MASLDSLPAAIHPENQARSAVSPEFALLLACCALGERDSREVALRSRLEAGADWQQVLRLGEHHGVLPLVYQALRNFANLIPPAIFAELRGRYENNARRNLTFTRELFRILECLDKYAVPAIPYKGPVLAEFAYGDLALRNFSDLDILVPRAEVLQAKTALHSLGYQPALQLSETLEQAYLATGYEYTFDGPSGRNLLEIQWGIVPRFYAVDLSIDEFFERAQQGEVGGRKVRTLAGEDLFLSLCVHAAKHAWIRLCWLRDIAGVLESQQFDWDSVAERSRELGIRRMVDISLLLAHRLLGAGVPDSCLQNARGDREIEPLYAEIVRHMPGGEEYRTESLKYFQLIFRLRERASDKLRFALRLAFTPSMGEWTLVQLPAPLFPLYRVIRMYRLAARFLRNFTSDRGS